MPISIGHPVGRASYSYAYGTDYGEKKESAGSRYCHVFHRALYSRSIGRTLPKKAHPEYPLAMNIANVCMTRHVLAQTHEFVFTLNNMMTFILRCTHSRLPWAGKGVEVASVASGRISPELVKRIYLPAPLSFPVDLLHESLDCLLQ